MEVKIEKMYGDKRKSGWVWERQGSILNVGFNKDQDLN
jgi:hypothetical protein